jgi:hypothetical protein
MMCCVITRYHPMVGCDLHTSQVAFPVPIPPPIPYMPHFAAALVRIGPWWMAEPRESPTVETAAGAAMAKIFDIGMFIPQLGVNSPIILAFLWLLSCSQAHFGVASVQIKTNDGQGPVAVALALVANPQLNCNDALPLPKIAPEPLPLPLPTGILLAPNTVVAGLTLGDLLAGILSMVLTSVITGAIGAAVGALGKPLNALASRIIGRTVGPLGEKILGTLLGWVVGSPAGYSFSLPNLGSLLNSPIIQGLSESAGSLVDSVANRWGLNDYFNDVALIPTFPLTGPVPAVPVPASAVEGPLSLLQGPLDLIAGR